MACQLRDDTLVTLGDVADVIGGRESDVRSWLKDAVPPLRHPSDTAAEMESSA